MIRSMTGAILVASSSVGWALGAGLAARLERRIHLHNDAQGFLFGTAVTAEAINTMVHPPTAKAA